MISHFAAAGGHAGQALPISSNSESTGGSLDSIGRVLVVHSDRLYSDLLRRSIQALVTTAKVLVACTIADASVALAREPVDLLVTSVLAGDGEVISELPEWVQRKQSVHHVIVITSRKEPWVLEQLAQSPIRGLCDAEGGVDELARALATVAAGEVYWSATARTALGQGRIELSRANLSPTERLVLAVIGGGCDDNLAAAELRMAPSTIATVRRQLHRKLGAQHRGELMQAALSYGAVIVHAGMVIRPGFPALLAARNARSA